MAGVEAQWRAVDPFTLFKASTSTTSSLLRISENIGIEQKLNHIFGYVVSIIDLLLNSFI